MFGLTQLGTVHTAISLVAIAAGVLAIGALAALRKSFGRSSQTVQAVSYTSTAFFHTIPGFTESLTRLPLESSVLPSQEAPEFQVIYGVLLLLFVIGLFLQLRWLRGGAGRAG